MFRRLRLWVNLNPQVKLILCFPLHYLNTKKSGSMSDSLFFVNRLQGEPVAGQTACRLEN